MEQIVIRKFKDKSNTTIPVHLEPRHYESVKSLAEQANTSVRVVMAEILDVALDYVVVEE